MTSHADAHDLTERAAHLARLGWAVEKHAARGEVEVRIADLRATARVLEYPDLAHACDKGGDLLDGPVKLTDEPTGDAMRWTSCLPTLGSPCGNCHRCTEPQETN